MKDKVTIIVPIYNVEQYVEKCLRSLLRQTFSNVKIMAINDGSTDQSGDIAEKVAQSDSRIIYIKKPNGGYGSVLELAIKQAETDYFAICDPDDWLEDDCIEKLYKKAIESKADIVAANKYICEVGSDTKKPEPKRPYFDIEENKNYVGRNSNFYFMSPTPHAKLFNTSIARNIHFPEKTAFTDFLLFAYEVQKAKRIEYINEYLANYLIDRPGNSATDRKPKAIKDHIVVWNEIYNQCRMDDEKLLFRLFLELKTIIHVYVRNSENLFRDDYYSELKKINNCLSKHYKDILNSESLRLNIKNKLLIKLLSRDAGLRLYVHLMKSKRK